MGSEKRRFPRGRSGAERPAPNQGLFGALAIACGGAQGSDKRRFALGRSGAERPEAREGPGDVQPHGVVFADHCQGPSGLADMIVEASSV